MVCLLTLLISLEIYVIIFSGKIKGSFYLLLTTLMSSQVLSYFFGKKAIYKYGASDGASQQLRPNNLIMWQAIKWCDQNGYRSFFFGKTEPENEGLLRCKRGWGGEKEKINYYKYDLVKDTFVGDHHRPKTYYNFFKKLPVPLLNLTGSLLYRHVG